MDFNGVIINDEPLHMKAYQEIFAKEGIALSEDHYYSCMGMDDKAFVGAQYKRAEKEAAAEKTSEIIQVKSARWRELVEKEVPLFEGAENFVRKMAQDFELGIVSMARREEIEFVLEKTALRDCFTIVVSAEDVSNHKPDPECYQTGFRLIDGARTMLGANPITRVDCLVIEDAPQGILAGKRAGLKTLGVTNTVSAEQLREAGADSVTKSLSDWMPDSLRRVFV